MNSNTLLADPTAIEIEKFITHPDSITIVVRSIQPAAACPLCNHLSRSLKTRYLRRLADLPWHGVSVCDGQVFLDKKLSFDSSVFSS